jgi:hypothetical protein
MMVAASPIDVPGDHRGARLGVEQAELEAGPQRLVDPALMTKMLIFPPSRIRPARRSSSAEPGGVIAEDFLSGFSGRGVKRG